MRYKVYTKNDTGNERWSDEYEIFADSDEEAESIALDRWLTDRFGIAAVSADLRNWNDRQIRYFGQ